MIKNLKKFFISLLKQQMFILNFSILVPENQDKKEGEYIMTKAYVNEETLVGEIVQKHPECAEILMGIGMHCLGCPASQAESLRDACAVHDMEVQPVIDALNAKIAEGEK